MRNNIVIIEDRNGAIANKFGCQKHEYFGEKTAEEIDKSVIELFKKNPSAEKIIITVRLGVDDIDYTGIKFGLHIRLTNELKEKRFIPLIFLSEQTKEDILSWQVENSKDLTASLLFTNATKLVSFLNLKHTIDSFSDMLDKDDYVQLFLSKLLIKNQREQGHQLGNEWGVLRLAKFARKKLSDIEQPKDLYFKYRFSLSDLEISSQDKNITNIQGNNDCNFLLIDDNANKGWTELLTHIVNSEIINKFTNKTITKAFATFEEADVYEDYESHDLIFLDLRLTREEDNAKNKMLIGEYSGVKLLKKIKDPIKGNPGIQIIILTASNKAWNMKALLDAGADGYFVKESPEYPVNDETSKLNYNKLVETIQNCFKRRFLKDIYKIWQSAVDANTNPLNTFIKESNSMLDIAWNLIRQEQLDFGYLTLFQIIEQYANKIYDYRDNSIQIKGVKNYMIDKHKDNDIWKLTFNKDKRNGDYFSSGDEHKKKEVPVNNLYKASCILKFIFTKDDSFLIDFGKLNDLRHEIAHEGAKGQANIKSIKKVLEIIKMIRQ